MIRTAFAALTLLALPVGAVAQDKQAESGQPPKRIKSVTISATDKCPESTADEVVVCTKVDNPYRIPKELRDSGPIPSKNQAWTTRLATDTAKLPALPTSPRWRGNCVSSMTIPTEPIVA